MERAQSRLRATERIAAHLLKSGLAETSLRELASAAGISDRMLLYYFDNKVDVISSALTNVAADLAQVLGQAVPEGTKLTPMALVDRMSRLISSKQVKPFMSLWLEVVAAAARGGKPYAHVAGQIATGFLDWAESRLVETTESRRATAAMILAMIDGLALIEACTDARLTQQAAARMRQLALS